MQPTLEQFNELKQINAELLAALKHACASINMSYLYDAHYKANYDYAERYRMTIAKVEGQIT